MPYIPPEARERLNLLVDCLASRIESEGELNYAVTRLIRQYVRRQGESYATHNTVMGVITCVGSEHYRTQVAPYENIKRRDYGDVELTTPAETTEGDW